MRIAVFGTGAVGGYFGGRLARRRPGCLVHRARRTPRGVATTRVADHQPEGRSAPSGDRHRRSGHRRAGGRRALHGQAVRRGQLGATARSRSSDQTRWSSRCRTAWRRSRWCHGMSERAAWRVVSPTSWPWWTSRGTSGTPPPTGWYSASRRAQLSDRLLRFQEAGRRAGFVADLSTHIDLDLWVKFVRLGTWSGMTTATRSTMGVIRQHPALMRMMDAALDEAMAVGRARGIDVPRRARRRDAADGAQLPVRVEVLDARGPRARASSRAALAERRDRPDGRGKRRLRRRRTRSSTRSCCRIRTDGDT